ncbi:unnamed protein product [Rotaria sp. Silwood1]|nr:unnamed protein product [Rotaria sp. Silwood1]CAF1675963.1 unnamed protein product [Rotaria sp. Silwood1]CAF3862874.1 unnamed protein product [Rotaria sp. Silwood1]CAF4874508.1 unnamed protein product [Rotaria sp. Silwood1]
MHSTLTTDLSILYENLNETTSTNNENVVLIKTGAFNPIHRAHISNMIKTKEYLECVHGFRVIGGYLSPSHDQYVQAKLDEEFISGHHRIRMCEEAIKEANQQYWLSVDKAEIMAPQLISLLKVTLSLQMFINEMVKLERPIRVIYVAGLDLFNDCHGMKGMQQSPWNGIAVVYRSGEQEDLIKSMHSLTSEKLYYVRDDSPDNQTEGLNQISSTQIRQMMKNEQSCEHLTYSSVLNYLKMISI